MKQELEQKECIWDIPEDKRHCEFCTANCVNAHAVSTSTEVEQAAIAQKTTDKVPTDFTMTEASAELEQVAKYLYPYEKVTLARGNICLSCWKVKRDAFKAGAEWQKKQDELTWENIRQIVKIADMLLVDGDNSKKFPEEQRYYEEILKLYKEEKK